MESEILQMINEIYILATIGIIEISILLAIVIAAIISK